MVRGVSDGFMEAFAPHLTVYASDHELQGEPGRHQQQERRRLHAAADGDHPRRGDARSDQAADRSEHPRRQPALPDRQRRLRPRVGGRLRQPPDHHQPDEEPADRGAARRPALQDLPVDAARSPSTTRDLAKVAKVESPRVYRIVATGTSGRVKKKITAIIDTKRVAGQPADAEPGRGEGGGRPPVLARGINARPWPTPSAASTSGRTRSSSPFSRWAFAPTRCAACWRPPSRPARRRCCSARWTPCARGWRRCRAR